MGSGIEVGPGEYPFRLLPEGATVRYIDRWRHDARAALIGDLGTDPHGERSTLPREFVDPDLVMDFNKERLGALASSSEDFVIASHVLEHLAEPMGFLADIHRVLRPGGVALVLMPDRYRTEDRFREPTPLAHVVAEREARVEEVSDAHVVEFLKDRGVPLPGTPSERRRLLDRHKERSIHVHCWSAVEFIEVVKWGIEHEGLQWEFVDGCAAEPPIHYEFGYLLRRSESTLSPEARGNQFDGEWQEWRSGQLRTRPEALGPPHHRLPLWAYRFARGQIRRHSVLGSLYRNGGLVLGRSKRFARRAVRRIKLR